MPVDFWDRLGWAVWLGWAVCGVSLIGSLVLHREFLFVFCGDSGVPGSNVKERPGDPDVRGLVRTQREVCSREPSVLSYNSLEGASVCLTGTQVREVEKVG